MKANEPGTGDSSGSPAIFLQRGNGRYKAHKWTPEDPAYQLLRWALLIAGGAYLTHLVMDGFTAKSLPLAGTR